MDFSKMKAAASAAGSHLKEFGHAASAKVASAADAARQASSDAAKDIKKSAQQMGSSSGSGLIGQSLTVGGRALYVDSLLAEGGFGSVYSAEVVEADPTKRSQVPDKVVLKRMFAGSRELAVQLVNEVKLMKRLVHPNVVKVLAAETKPLGPEGMEILLVMELCPGGHLLTRLNALKDAKRILPWTKILDVFLQIVRPVAAMHALQPPVAHRDLKFENVLIAADGSLRLCDFGSASSHAGVIADKADRAEQEDAVLRYTTPHFRSPEMVDLYSGLELDTRSDVWALGCMLYGLAYGAHPFQDSGNLAIMSARYRLPTSPPFPAPIHTLIRACLAYRPTERPTADGMVAYCEACVALGEGATAFPPLSLSGGASVRSAVVPAPVASPSEAASSDGSVLITGNSDGAGGEGAAGGGSGGGAAAPSTRPAAYHTPSAQDILHQVQAQALCAASAASSGGAKSGALAARLAKKGGAPGPGPAAPAPAPTPAPAPPPFVAPTPAPAPAPAPAVLRPVSAGAPAAAFTSGPSLPASGGGGFDDFDFGFSGSAGGEGVEGSGAAAAPAAAAPQLRPASAGPAPAPVSAPAPGGGSLDDFFSGSTESGSGGAAGGESSLLGFGSSSGLEDPFASFGLGAAAKGGKGAAAAPAPAPSFPAPADDPFNF